MNAFKLVFESALKYRFYIGVAILSMTGLVALQLLVPWSVRELLRAVRVQADTGVVKRLALLLMAVYVGRIGLQFCNRYFSHVAGWNVVSDVRHRLYVHLQRLSMRFHEDQQTGALMSRIINDSNMFESLISHAVPDTLVNIMRLIGVAIVLSTINAKLVLLTLIPVPFIVWTMRAMAIRMRPAFPVSGRRSWPTLTLRSTTIFPVSGRLRPSRARTPRRSGWKGILSAIEIPCFRPCV